MKKEAVIILLMILSISTVFGQKEADLPKSVSDWFSKKLIQNVLSKSFESKDGFFVKDSVSIIGYLKGYDETSRINSGIVYHENLLTSDDLPTTIRIYSDGRFEVSYLAFHPSTNYLVFNNSFFEYYIEPGQSLAVVLDVKDVMDKGNSSSKSKLSYLGHLADINNELTSYMLGIPDFDDFRNDMISLSPDEFSQKMLVAWDADLKRFNEISSKFSTLSAKLIRNNIDLNYGTRLFDFVLHRSYLTKQDTMNQKLKIPVSENYYQFINRIDLDDISLLALQDYSIFINRFEFSSLLPFIKYQSEENYDELLFNDFKKIYKTDKVPFSFKVASLRRISSIIKSLNNKDMILEKVDLFQNGITEPLFEKELNELLQNKLNKLHGYDLPNTLAAEAFQKIIDNHKGKILVVDFWAQWCGPCRIGIESTVDERTALSDHPDLEFIFITDEEGTPDKEFFDKYNKENLMANSYRVSAADYRAFRELFKFNGIPRYILVNDQGKIMDDNFKRNLLNSELSGRFPEKFKDIDTYNTKKGGH